MIARGADQPSAPIDFPYAFNRPGEAIELYEGGISGFDASEVSGRVYLRTHGRTGLRWEVNAGENDHSMSLDDVDLSLIEMRNSGPVKAFRRRPTSGWINRAEFGSPSLLTKQVRVGWINVPELPCHEKLGSVDGRQWRGRISFAIGDWSISIDERPDHSDVFRDVGDEDVYVVTHFMEVRLAGEKSFPVSEAAKMIEALRVRASSKFVTDGS